MKMVRQLSGSIEQHVLSAALGQTYEGQSDDRGDFVFFVGKSFADKCRFDSWKSYHGLAGFCVDAEGVHGTD